MLVSYLIGIDGGGTGCRARLRDRDGRSLAEGSGGPANIRLGIAQAWGNILDAVDEALAAAGLTRAIFADAAIGLGLAGIVTPADAAATIAAGPMFATMAAASDAHAACLGAFSGRDGAILITGTGSAGYAWVDAQGHHVGGWGFEVSDRGSAAVLGRAAIALALDGHDRVIAPSSLTAAIIDHFGGGPADVVAWVADARPRDYGRLAPIVIDHALAGDVHALNLVRNAVRDVEALMARLAVIGTGRVALIGGMAAPYAAWLSPWARSILHPADADPVDGAILLAEMAIEQTTTRGHP